VTNAKPTQTAIAAAIGVAPSRVVALRVQGMPCDSVENAVRWHADNIRPMPNRRPSVRSDDARRLARVAALSPIAAVALQVGRFDLVRDELQTAMRAVPQRVRHHVKVDADVLAELCGPVLVAMSEIAGDTAQVAALTDSEADAMGRFWYCVAAGEDFPADWLDAEPSVY